jgi:hypothetical protein
MRHAGLPARTVLWAHRARQSLTLALAGSGSAAATGWLPVAQSSQGLARIGAGQPRLPTLVPFSAVHTAAYRDCTLVPNTEELWKFHDTSEK